MNIRAKGRRAEIEMARLLQAMFGDGSKAGPSFQTDAQHQPDVDSPTLKSAMIHPEVKNHRKPQISDWIQQATNDCLEGETPLVFWKQPDGKGWVAIIRFDDLPKFIEHE